MAAIKTEIQGPWTRCLKGCPWKTLRGFPHYNYPLNTAASGWRPVPVSEVERGDARQDAPSCPAPLGAGTRIPGTQRRAELLGVLSFAYFSLHQAAVPKQRKVSRPGWAKRELSAEHDNQPGQPGVGLRSRSAQPTTASPPPPHPARPPSCPAP